MGNIKVSIISPKVAGAVHKIYDSLKEDLNPSFIDWERIDYIWSKDTLYSLENYEVYYSRGDRQKIPITDIPLIAKNELGLTSFHYAPNQFDLLKLFRKRYNIYIYVDYLNSRGVITLLKEGNHIPLYDSRIDLDEPDLLGSLCIISANYVLKGELPEKEKKDTTSYKEQIIRKLSNYLSKNPEIRFCQALQNMKINLMDTDSGMIKDNYNTPDSVTYSRMSEH